MKPSVLSPEQLYDLFLMGLTWLRNEREDILARPGLSVFSSHARAKAIIEAQRKSLVTNSKLITLTMQHAEIIKADKRPTKSEIVKKINKSKAHVLTLVIPDQSLNYTKFFGPQGYLHVITAAGIEQALEVASKHAKLIDEVRFINGWEIHKSSMRKFNADRGGSSTSKKGAPQQSGASESIGRIPEAPYGEGDFEW